MVFVPQPSVGVGQNPLLLSTLVFNVMDNMNEQSGKTLNWEFSLTDKAGLNTKQPKVK